MSKLEIANYLVALHSLMEAQEATGLHKSQVFVAEYEKHWGLLKDMIEKESEDAR